MRSRAFNDDGDEGHSEERLATVGDSSCSADGPIYSDHAQGGYVDNISLAGQCHARRPLLVPSPPHLDYTGSGSPRPGD